MNLNFPLNNIVVLINLLVMVPDCVKKKIKHVLRNFAN